MEEEYTSSTYVPLSALCHWLYCPRRTALIHVERLWADNWATAEGNALHEKAHSGQSESRPGLRITRGLPVWSEAHGLKGACDVVEFYDDNLVIPIEYKRGRPKSHRADEAQLCAQAICLEENFHRAPGSIRRGFIFYGSQQRRTQVTFDSTLRELTLSIAEAVRNMIQKKQTPTADYNPKLCDRCSLIHLCQPKSMRLKHGVSKWFADKLLIEF